MTIKLEKNKSRRLIEQLVEKFEQLPKSRLKEINEADTRRMFIMPLFKALGWDVYNDFTSNEVIEEETSISGRIDYSFRLHNTTQFILEAKAIPEDLDKEEWANQAVEYGWNKGIPWVVLTDFEGLKVFNSEWRMETPRANIDLSYKDYLTKFDKLWLLSKKSFNKNNLDKLASDWGITAKRESVNEHLAKDLLEWRQLLSKYFTQWNKDKKIERKEIEEAVQRILDRLIFMRVVEDKDIEDKRLWQSYREWKEDGYIPQNFVQKLTPIFREFDKKYNSNLFEKHLCEELYTTQEPFKKIIPGLYGTKEKGVKYRFDAIDADVLGNVYEQYLGYVQGREGGKSKRKKQGIYYTPTYIVDYIVQNTLGKLLEEKSLIEIENLKVLDLACGSGSFLIRAFDALNDKLKKERGNSNGQDAALRKYRILTNNIHGVDLDSQAVEIARLNLLLKALEPDHKLPMLNENIKNGNSLIENKKIDSKSFNWKEEFPAVFKNGGFDIVVGNPPYLKEMDNKELFRQIKRGKYEKYYQGKMDFWYFFLHRAIDVTKDGGYIGFITNSYFTKSAGATKLIKRIKKELVLVRVVDFGDLRIFGDVSGRHMIHIYRKALLKNRDKTILIKEKELGKISEQMEGKINYLEVIKDGKMYLDTQGTVNFKNTIPLGQIYESSTGVQESTDKVSKKAYVDKNGEGIEIGDGVFVISSPEVKKLNLLKKEKKVLKKYLNVGNIKRYAFNYKNEYLIYSDKNVKEQIKSGEYPNIKRHLDMMRDYITSSNKPYGLHRPRKKRYFEDPKLICKGMFSYPEFVYDDESYYVGFSFSVILTKSKEYDLKFLLGILNSSLGNYWFQLNGKRRGVGVDIGVQVYREFPVIATDSANQDKLIKVVDEMLHLKEQLKDKIQDSEDWKKLNSRINKLDRKIDSKVNSLYNLTSEEIKIVENSSAKS